MTIQSGFPLSYAKKILVTQAKKSTSCITKLLLAFDITELINIYGFTSLPWFIWLAFITPTVDLELSSWRVMRKAIHQYLLIIHFSSEHLRGHPVGGADDGQRLLVFFLAAERGKRKRWMDGRKLHDKPALVLSKKNLSNLFHNICLIMEVVLVCNQLLFFIINESFFFKQNDKYLLKCEDFLLLSCNKISNVKNVTLGCR